MAVAGDDGAGDGRHAESRTTGGGTLGFAVGGSGAARLCGRQATMWKLDIKPDPPAPGKEGQKHR